MSDIAPFGYIRRYVDDDYAEARDRELEEFLAMKMQQRLVSVVTSTTRPTVNLTRGQTIYESDTGNTLVWYGTTTGWQKPWNQPWGQQAISSASVSQGTITAVTDLTGIGTVSFTGIAGRRLMIRGVARFQSTVAADYARLVIATGAGTQLHAADAPMPLANTDVTVIDEVFAATVTGTNDFKLRAQRSVGTGTVTMVASGVVPAFILV